MDSKRKPTHKVQVTVYGDPEDPEYESALDLKRRIESSLRPGDEGEIVLRPSVTLFGQKRRDIDILLFARFGRGLKRRVRVGNPPAEREVAFFNFFATIEVKSHEDVHFDDFAAWVMYKGKPSNATSQSEAQKTSAFSYIQNLLGWSPFVCNLIWFKNVARAKLPGSRPHNYLSADCTLEDLLQRLVAGKPPYDAAAPHGPLRFFCTKLSEAAELSAKQNRLFSLIAEQKQSQGSLTSQKLHRLMRPLLRDQVYAQSIGEKLVLLRGRAGTGKTLKLLHLAYDLCTTRGQRVLILTYNRMLVSDLQRMMALAGVSSDLDRSTVEIETVHAYIRQLLKHFGIQFSDQDFLQNYTELKATLLSYLETELITETDMRSYKHQHRADLNWDTILIDEGQDWPEDEKAILFRLFDSKNFVVAIGTGQLVRSIELADWTKDIDAYRPPGEKRSLRQKRNLSDFVSLFAHSRGINWDLQANDQLIGGRVLVVVGPYTHALHVRLSTDGRKDGTTAYDHLFLAPPTLTVRDENQNGKRKSFALKSLFGSWGLKIWDGISRTSRTEYPTDIEEYRVVSYESARGLEGWIVVCLNLDQFAGYKSEYPYIVEEQQSQAQLSFGMQSPAERVDELVSEWLLIAMTRAVDTLVITLSDDSSEFSRSLLRLATQCADYVEIIRA